MTESTHQTTANPAVPGPARIGDRTRWADAVAELRQLHREEAAAEDRDEWAAAADLRILFAGQPGSAKGAGPRTD